MYPSRDILVEMTTRKHIMPNSRKWSLCNRGQRRCKSACAFAQADLPHRCPLTGSVDTVVYIHGCACLSGPLLYASITLEPFFHCVSYNPSHEKKVSTWNNDSLVFYSIQLFRKRAANTEVRHCNCCSHILRSDLIISWLICG